MIDRYARGLSIGTVSLGASVASASAAPAPEPTRVIVPGAAFWLDPGTGVSVTGSDVDSVTVQICNLVCSQTGSNRPTRVTSSLLGGRTALRFNQASAQSLVAADTQHLSGSTTSFTWFFVLAPDSFPVTQTSPVNDTRQYLLYPGNDTLTTALNRIAWAYRANPTGLARTVPGYSDNDTVPWKTSPIHSCNRPQVLAFRNNASNGQGAIFLDGYKIVDGLSYVARAFNNGFTIGRPFGVPSGGPDEYYSGDLGDILGYLSALTDQQVLDQSIELATYYSIDRRISRLQALLPELLINARSNFFPASGTVNEIMNQGVNHTPAAAPTAFVAASSGVRPTLITINEGGTDYPAFDFDGTDDVMTGTATGLHGGDIITNTGDWVIRIVGRVDAVDTDSASPQSNDVFLADSGGNFSIGAIRSSTGIYAYVWDGAAKTTAAIALGALPTGLFRFQCRREGATIYAKLNGGAEVSVGSVGTIAAGALSDALQLGRRGSTSTFLNGAVVDVFTKKAPTGPQLTELTAADAALYPTIAA